MKPPSLPLVLAIVGAIMFAAGLFNTVRLIAKMEDRKYSIESYNVWKKINPAIELTHQEWIIATQNGNLK